jgi:hypothetical protein
MKGNRQYARRFRETNALVSMELWLDKSFVTLRLQSDQGQLLDQQELRQACPFNSHRRRTAGVTFDDLRGTAVTRLALAESRGRDRDDHHSLRDVRSILDAHYLHGDPALAESDR